MVGLFWLVARVEQQFIKPRVLGQTHEQDKNL